MGNRWCRCRVSRGFSERSTDEINSPTIRNTFVSGRLGFKNGVFLSCLYSSYCTFEQRGHEATAVYISGGFVFLCVGPVVGRRSSSTRQSNSLRTTFWRASHLPTSEAIFRDPLN